MTPETLLTLPEELLILGMDEIDPEIRAELAGSNDDFVLTLPKSRNSSVLVDAAIAGLLATFRSPCNLVDAVLLYTLPRRLEAKEVLKASLPVIENFFERGLLVDALASSPQGSLEAAYTPGTTFDGLTILRTLQVMTDTDVYQVRQGRASGGFAALKLFRSGDHSAVGSLENETAILGYLDGHCAPRLLKRGRVDGQGYLLMEWCSGIPADLAASEWRQSGGSSSRLRLLEIAIRVVRTFARLHHRGVLHGDVHPRNILIDGDGTASLIDFGPSCRIEEAANARRAGIPFYFEPEYAAAALAEETAAPPSAVGEQYSVAALLYLLFTGAHTHDFSPRRLQTLEQIASQPPKAFSDRGIASWPAVERPLLRALTKDPARRFGSLSEFAEALELALESELESVQDLSHSAESARSRSVLAPSQLARFADELVKLAGWDGPWLAKTFSSPPTTSLAYGSAGVACALYRLASLRDATSSGASARPFGSVVARRFSMSIARW